MLFFTYRNLADILENPMSGTKPTNTHIVVRSFRNQQMYLTDWNIVGNMFQWSKYRDSALRMTHTEALHVVKKASREYGAECAAQDATGTFSTPKMIDQPQQQQQAQHGFTSCADQIAQDDRPAIIAPWNRMGRVKPGKYGALQNVIPISSQGEVIAHVNCGFGRGPAHAKLISAAPDLLASLNALETFLRMDGVALPVDLLDQCHAAISKAEGR